MAVATAGGLVAQTAAATITVTNTNDSGPGSLRQAIFDADPGDEIIFDAALDGIPIVLTSGELVIDKELTITGRGEGNTLVDGDGSSRVFFVEDWSLPYFSVRMSDMTVRNGNTPQDGGGISLINATLAMDHCTISGNTAGLDGGGIMQTIGALTLSHCTISDNTTDVSGGGIFSSGETLTLVDHCTISGNTAYRYGGGIQHDQGTLTLSNSTISDNTAQRDGGGMYNLSGPLSLFNSIVSGNNAQWDGGGIWTAGDPPTIDHCTISGNTAGEGGGIWFEYNGVLKHSTVSGNSANVGGGIWTMGYGPLTVDHCTVSGNTAIFSGGGIWFQGTMSLYSSTVSGNSAGGQGGGGIHDATPVDDYRGLTLSSSLVADQIQGTDCAREWASNVPVSQGYNLDSDDTCGLDQPTDLPGTDPVLGPLQDNGGPTETHALLLGSPAVDAGSCPGVTTDQRGLPRPVDTPSVPNVDDGCDIGAFESQWPLLVVLESFTAEVTRRGVLVKWKTAMEIDNIGFRILRGREGEDPVVITSLIPARGNELEGAEYEYLDTDRQMRGTVYYYLEDIDIYGQVTRQGPAVVTISRTRVVPGRGEHPRSRERHHPPAP